MTRIKICGLTQPADVEAAVEAGADALGFVLAPSPRQVSVARARELVQATPGGVHTYAVFRQVDAGAVAQAGAAAVKGIQGHGSLATLPVVCDGPDLAVDLEGFQPGQVVLIDGPDPGSGRPPDLHRVADALAGRGLRLVLAGGLKPETVGAAIAQLQPFAVDVSSGVELRRGVKDPARIHAFCSAVRSAS
jgi:phosphoribosylanthranilate isomerase